MRPDTHFFSSPSCLAIDSLLCLIPSPPLTSAAIYLHPSWQEIKCCVPQFPNKAQTRVNPRVTRRRKYSRIKKKGRTLQKSTHLKKKKKILTFSRGKKKRNLLHDRSTVSVYWHSDCIWKAVLKRFFFVLLFEEMGVYLKRESVYLMYHTPPKRFTYCSVICYFKSSHPHFLGG